MNVIRMFNRYMHPKMVNINRAATRVQVVQRKIAQVATSILAIMQPFTYFVRRYKNIICGCDVYLNLKIGVLDSERNYE